MLIEIRCLNFSDFDASQGKYVECGEKLIVTKDQFGEFVTCPKCHQPVEVPYDHETQDEVATATDKASGQGKQSRSSAGSVDAAARSVRAIRKAKQRESRGLPKEKKLNEAPEKRVPGQPTSNKSERQSPGVPPKSRTKEAAAIEASPSNLKRDQIRSRSTPGQPADRTGKQKSPKPASNQPSSTQSNSKRAVSNRPGEKPAGTKRKVTQRPLQKSSDLMSMDFRQQDVQPALREDRKDRCKKCGNLNRDGQCTACKYVEPKFEKLFQPLDEIEFELAGFQRWFCRTMNEGVSIKVLEYVSHGLLGLLGLFLITAAALGFMGYGVGPIGGVVLLFLTVSAGLLYCSFIYKGHQFMRDPNARLAWFQKPFWRFILQMARTMRWEGYDSKLKNRRIIKIRERLFGDDDLLEVEGIKTCQVLDLQGTSVTDRGLLDLYDLKHLQSVVLLHTDVSHEGVFRLQQSFPRLWIWY